MMTLIIVASLVLSAPRPVGFQKSRAAGASAEQVLSLLQSPDPNEKGEALEVIAQTRRLQQDVRVRQVVLRELAKARADRIARKSAAAAPDHRAVELLLALIRTAAKFPGPEVQKALLPHLGQRAIAQRSVADSGNAAVDDLVRLYESGEGDSEPELVRFGALLTLAEITNRGALSSGQRSRISAVWP